MKKTGVLLINLGTPDACDVSFVRKYLKEFLSDPRVIDLPVFLRQLLLHLIILPFRSKKTAAAYQQIWTKNGSPLLCHSVDLEKNLSKQLGDAYEVALGMRYGNPSIAAALSRLKHCNRLIVLPLFPQYSSAATGSALEKTFSLLSQQWNIPEIITLRDFYDHPKFIQASAEIINRSISNKKIDKLVLSYHGLPERHIKKSGCINPGTQQACDCITQGNHFCYRAQCYATSYAIAQHLNLSANEYTVCFQSRLGKTPWIKPYTDEVFPALIEKNIRNIAIACPSFVADCLETLEEMGMRGREEWKKLGGENFILVPCLNAELSWVEALANMVRIEQKA